MLGGPVDAVGPAEGADVGYTVGMGFEARLGLDVIVALGCSLPKVGEPVGVGEVVGYSVGLKVGEPVGKAEGTAVGVAVGVVVPDGEYVGLSVGLVVGCPIGPFVGEDVSIEDGASVGISVGPSLGLSSGQLQFTWKSNHPKRPVPPLAAWYSSPKALVCEPGTTDPLISTL